MVPVRMVILDSTSRVITVIGNARGLWARGQANARELLDIGSLASVVGLRTVPYYGYGRIIYGIYGPTLKLRRYGTGIRYG